MWATVLKFAPAVLGLLSQVSPSVFGGIAKKAEASPGATLGTILAGGGLLSNPNFNAFLADTLVRFAEMLRSIPSGVAQ